MQFIKEDLTGLQKELLNAQYREEPKKSWLPVALSLARKLIRAFLQYVDGGHFATSCMWDRAACQQT
jgi:membrane-associated PAP2 superfamily phosphatase